MGWGTSFGSDPLHALNLCLSYCYVTLRVTPFAQTHPGPFHLPAVLDDLESLPRMLDHFQHHLVCLLQGAYPVAQPLCLILSIDPDFPEAGHAGSKIPL